MIHWNQFFTLTNFLLMLPVIAAAIYLMPMLYHSLVEAIMPWKEVNATNEKTWNGVDRRKKMERRNAERLAAAREAWRRGDPEAANLVGRRKSDYEALGIPMPESQSQ